MNRRLLPPPTPVRRTTPTSSTIRIEPGYSQLDWARLQSSGENLSGVERPDYYAPSEVRQHKSMHDAWCILEGKIYNITPYIPYHPGGVKELMRAAGKDGTRLFMEAHSWINYDTMLANCFVGYVVPEPEQYE